MAIRAGFESTGLVPLSLERALSKLPKEATDETTGVQQQLVKQLSHIRYNPPPTTQAKRPRKKEKLPPGAAYTCSADHSESDSTSDEEVPARQTRPKKTVPVRLTSDTEDESCSQEDDDNSSEEEDGSSDEEEDRRLNVQHIVDSLNETWQEEDNEEAEELLSGVMAPVAAGGDEQLVFKPQSYIACLYQDNWYVGQVLDKTGEPRAESGDQYVLVSFMEWSGTKKDVLKWPSRQDVLNVLKDDILLPCQAPEPIATSSSGRSMTFSLSQTDYNKAKQLFMQKDYYLTLICFPQTSKCNCRNLCGYLSVFKVTGKCCVVFMGMYLCRHLCFCELLSRYGTVPHTGTRKKGFYLRLYISYTYGRYLTFYVFLFENVLKGLDNNFRRNMPKQIP